MTSEEVAELIEQVQQLLQDAGIDPESPLGVGAFPAVFAALRSGEEVRPLQLEREEEAQPQRNEGALHRVAEWLNVEQERVADLLEFIDDGLQIHIGLNQLPGSNAATQRLLAFVYLGAVRVGLGRTEVRNTELNDVLDAYGVFDQNVWTNLERAENAFGRRGDRGEYTYRLSVPGFQKAREVIRGLIDAA